MYQVHFEAAIGDYSEGFTISLSGNGEKVKDYRTREGFFTVKETCTCGGSYPWCARCEEEGGMVVVACRLTIEEFKVNFGEWLVSDGWSNAT